MVAKVEKKMKKEKKDKKDKKEKKSKSKSKSEEIVPPESKAVEKVNTKDKKKKEGKNKDSSKKEMKEKKVSSTIGSNWTALQSQIKTDTKSEKTKVTKDKKDRKDKEKKKDKKEPKSKKEKEKKETESDESKKKIDLWFDDIKQEDLVKAYGSNISIEIPKDGHVATRVSTPDEDGIQQETGKKRSRENDDGSSDDSGDEDNGNNNSDSQKGEAALTKRQRKRLRRQRILAQHAAESEDEAAKSSSNPVKEAKMGKYVALDCEMVGVGPEGTQHALARVSIVNYNGAVLMDKYVKPQEKVVDYRTHITGIKPGQLDNAEDFKTVQAEVAKMFKNRIVVGHALKHDFGVLLLSHPTTCIRDTSLYRPFRKLTKGKTPSLKRLAKAIMKADIQQGVHSSVEDARMAMSLFKKHKTEWDKMVTQWKQRRDTAITNKSKVVGN